MQKGGMLNSHIAKVLADLGHTDTICIGDCGLPVPAGVQKIDLAVTFGVPSFEQVVRAVQETMQVEALLIARPMKTENPKAYNLLMELYPPGRYEWSKTDHDTLKEATKKCKCIIRTGEATPYANVILQADCIFNEEK